MKSSKSELREAMLAALEQDVPKPRASFAYSLGIAAVAVIMVLLPLIYIGLVGGISYGVFWHATENVDMLSDNSGARKLYIVPLVIGPVLVFFMLKPLFAKHEFVDDRVELDPAKEPYLFAFVERLCAAVGADAPRRILVDCEANASAGFLHGASGVATRGRELTIGLPLIASLSARQFAGILAHEFGHFAQGAGMRFGFLVNRTNNWLARVVYVRDDWDKRLEGWSRNGWGWLGILGYIARGFVWLTRRVLFGLMWVGRAASSYSSRQMEYDADHFEVQIAGSRGFTQSTRAIYLLSAGRARTNGMLGQAWSERRLADDIVALTARNATQFSKDDRKAILGKIDEEETHLFATHPRSIDRIRAAEAADSAGLFDVEAPARVLFDDFASACRTATLSEYDAQLGSSFKMDCLVPSESLLAERAADDERGEAFERFFANTASPLRPLEIGEVESTEDYGAVLQELRAQFESGREAYAAELEQLEQAHHDIHQAESDCAWIEAGSRGAGDEAETRRSEAAGRIEQIGARMQPFERIVSRRLALGLAVTCEQDDGGQSADRARALTEAARVTALAMPCATALRRAVGVVGHLLQSMDEDEKPNSKLMKTINRHAGRLREELAAALDSVGETLYPFDHSDESITLRGYLRQGEVPSRRDAGRLLGAASEFVERLYDVDYRLRSHLAEIAEQAEEATRAPA